MITREEMQALLRIQENQKEADRHYWFTFEQSKFVIHVLLEGDFEEGVGRWKDLSGRYSALIHPAHNPGSQKHVHTYSRGRQLFALNWDGSTRHGVAGTRIPKRLVRDLSRVCHGLQFPPGNILESFEAPGWIELMFESVTKKRV